MAVISKDFQYTTALLHFFAFNHVPTKYHLQSVCKSSSEMQWVLTGQKNAVRLYWLSRKDVFRSKDGGVENLGSIIQGMCLH